MPADLEAVLAVLAGRLGVDPGDPSDEHDRWAVYRDALDDPAHLPDLFDVVALEPLDSISLGIVLHLLGGLPPSERPSWIDRLGNDRSRAYATCRARELAVLQGDSVTALLDDPSVQDSWSDWLQLGLAGSSDERAVLHRLATEGRTKRIRRLASERIRTIEHRGPGTS
ncbi:hypothetical protein AB0N87_09415 [Streptomyces sp. NPDC093228]|uniref:hypothetical protein n=1 Tax=unclassified Streptomyces TaxID=2593676 RepID=UPI000740FCDF|nr:MULTISPECIES: hypothetical protein [unclassified Streptomyces]KUJ41139.1 hypothetical protein ADL25_17040 [Streptomyces sp. NRRL F-5122]MDX3260970.1 hypothetical protein [Streptomyces sp. MI02-2A]REE64736.1 hypothetical protein BX257_7436 [Streptomyces sp. 3212.3]